MSGTCCTPPPHAVPFLCKKLQRTRRPRLTPSPCSPTGSDALVGILVVDKEEPRSKRGHGDACASAGGVRTAMLASRPLREGRAPAVRVRRGPGRFGTGQTSSVPTSYMLGPEVHASLTCVGFTNDPHSLICRKATRHLVSPSTRRPRLDTGRQPPGLKSGSSAHAIRPYRFALTVWCRFQQSHVYRNRLLRRLPTTTQSRSNRSGGHVIVPAIQPIIVYSLLDTMRAGVVAPQPPITPVELFGGKPVSPFIPPKSPRPPPKSPFTPPKEHQPSRRALRSSLLALGALDRPPLSGLPLSYPCPPCALRRRPDRA